jgi:hypothetical protein
VSLGMLGMGRGRGGEISTRQRGESGICIRANSRWKSAMSSYYCSGHTMDITKDMVLLDCECIEKL